MANQAEHRQGGYMSQDSGHDYVMWIAAVSGAAIGFAVGYFIAFHMVADRYSALAQSGLVGVTLGGGGAVIGAIVTYRLAKAILKN
jgi:hypothetical protein